LAFAICSRVFQHTPRFGVVANIGDPGADAQELAAIHCWQRDYSADHAHHGCHCFDHGGWCDKTRRFDAGDFLCELHAFDQRMCRAANQVVFTGHTEIHGGEMCLCDIVDMCPGICGFVDQHRQLPG
jgi:hypothetical protein